jgi:hypothetical protein
LICSFNFLIFLAVCLNISTVINIKILTNSNQQTQSYKFTSHIAAFLSGFDHWDAWNLHTNIWSKRSTDFKELSPCSVWYPLNRLMKCFIFYFTGTISFKSWLCQVCGGIKESWSTFDGSSKCCTKFSKLNLYKSWSMSKRSSQNCQFQWMKHWGKVLVNLRCTKFSK